MPSICLPVSRQRTIVQIGQNLCFQSVNLANEADFFNKEIDLLIGADFYCKLVKRDTKKKKKLKMYVYLQLSQFMDGV